MVHNPSRLLCSAARALLALLATQANAQPNLIVSSTPAQWYWEASSDEGISWVRNSLVVSDSSTNVLVRGVCEFPGPANTYFGGAAFDATYTGLGAAGLSDRIPLSSVNRCQIPGLLPQVAVTRWGATLKIDDEVDLFPPGLGPYWWGTGQNAPFRGSHVSGNPICAFGYTVILDGTLGDREVSAIYAREQFGPGGWIRLFRENDRSEIDNVYLHPVEQHPLTLHVVPSTETLALTLVFGIACVPRRRRNGHSHSFRHS